LCVRCVDTLASTTSAAVSATDSTAYQWSWVILVIIASAFIELSMAQLSISDVEATSRSLKLLNIIEKCLLRINEAARGSTVQAMSVQCWRAKVLTAQSEASTKQGSVVMWRRALYWILHLPLLFSVSVIPAGCVRNVLQ
jgi:hypothetical protein